MTDRWWESAPTVVEATAAPENDWWSSAEIASPAKRDQSFVKGLARTALGQGMAFGLGDELTAAYRALAGGEDYSTALEDERAKIRQFRDENPVISTIGEIGGAMATPGLGLLSGAIRPAASLAGRVWQGAKIGAGLGGAYGFTSAEGGDGDIIDQAANRLSGSAKGAVAGGIIGGAVPAAGSVVGGLIQNARDALSPTVVRARHGIEEAADEIFANRMRRAGVTPQEIANDLANGQAATKFRNSQASLPEMIVDAHPSMQALGGSVYRAGNDAQRIAGETLAERQGGNPAQGLFGRAKTTDEPTNQYERIVDTFKRAFGVKSKDFDRQTAAIKNEQSVLGNESYRRAFENHDDFVEPLTNTLTAWELRVRDEPGKPEQKALQAALDLFRRPADYASMGRVPFPIDTLKRFDAAKRSLDGMIGETQNANVKRLLTQFKNDTLDAIHGGDRTNPTLNRAYSEARNEWGSRAELLEALDMGRRYLADKSGEVTAQDFRALTRPQQAMFRLGVAKSLEPLLGSKAIGPNADFTNVLRKPAIYSKLRDIVPQGETAQKLNELIGRERRMSETAAKVTGNSATAERLAADREFAGRDLIGSAVDRYRATPSLVNLGLDVLSSAAERAFGFKDDMASALARRLFEADPGEQQVILQRIGQRLGKQKLSQFLDYLDRARLIGTTAVAARAGALSGDQPSLSPGQ